MAGKPGIIDLPRTTVFLLLLLVSILSFVVIHAIRNNRICIEINFRGPVIFTEYFCITGSTLRRGAIYYT